MDSFTSPTSTPLSTSKTTEMTEEERETHLSFMREALAMAELALTTNETPVGCIFVHHPTGTIIGRGMNATNASYNGTRHAEFIAISDILTTQDPTSKAGSGSGGKKYTPEILKECNLYVTVEPCIMCASLLRQFGVRKVFFGASNEKFGGCGGVLNIHVGNGASDREEEGEQESRKRHEDDYEVSGGWLREEAILLLRRFYVQENGRAPEPKRRGKEERVLKMVEPLVEKGG